MVRLNLNLRQMRREVISFPDSISTRDSRRCPKKSRKGAEKELKKGAGSKRAILKLLSDNPTMTQTELTEELELTRKQIQTDIKELKNEGTLVRKGSNRNGYWIVNRVD